MILNFLWTRMKHAIQNYEHESMHEMMILCSTHELCKVEKNWIDKMQEKNKMWLKYIKCMKILILRTENSDQTDKQTLQNWKQIWVIRRNHKYKLPKLGTVAVTEHKFIYTREDLSIICAHFGVTWFSRWNNELGRFIIHNQALIQDQNTET